MEQPRVPVWSHAGIICTGETYKNVVKMTFAKGASLEDPSGLFNASLEGNTRRAIDLHEGDKTIDEEALKALVRAAVALGHDGSAAAVARPLSEETKERLRSRSARRAKRVEDAQLAVDRHAVLHVLRPQGIAAAPSARRSTIIKRVEHREAVSLGEGAERRPRAFRDRSGQIFSLQAARMAASASAVISSIGLPSLRRATLANSFNPWTRIAQPRVRATLLCRRGARIGGEGIDEDIAVQELCGHSALTANWRLRQHRDFQPGGQLPGGRRECGQALARGRDRGRSRRCASPRSRTSTSSPSFNSSASTTAAGTRMARLLPHFDTRMEHTFDILIQSISKVDGIKARDPPTLNRRPVFPPAGLTRGSTSLSARRCGCPWI